MVTRVYAHILDEDRKINAVKMEQAFYAEHANPDFRDVRPPKETVDLDFDAFIDKLRTVPPEKLSMLAGLLKS